MGTFSRGILFFARYFLRVVINILGEEAPSMKKRKSKSSTPQTIPTPMCPSAEQTTQADIERLRRENKDLRRDLTKKKLEHAHQCTWSRKDGRLTSSWSDTLDRTNKSNVTYCPNNRIFRCSSFENEAASLTSFDSGLSSITDDDNISLDSFEIIELPTEIPPSVYQEGLEHVPISNEDSTICLVRDTNPSFVQEIYPNTNVYHEITENNNVEHETTPNISVDLEPRDNISVDLVTTDNMNLYTETTVNISVDHDTTDNITVDHDTTDNITVDHDTPDNITVDHDTTDTITVDHDTADNTNVDHERTDNMSENNTSTSEWTDINERDKLLKQLQLAQEENDRLLQYINDVSFMILDASPTLFEK